MTEKNSDELEAKERDDSARVSAVAAAVLGGAFTVAGVALSGPKTGLSIAVGAGIAVANLLTLRAIIGALLTTDGEDEALAAPAEAPADPVAEAEAEGAAQAAADPDGSKEAAASEAASKERGKRGGAAWGVFAVLKILILFGGIGLLLMRGWVEPIPLVIGYGVLPLGITASTLVASVRPKRRR